MPYGQRQHVDAFNRERAVVDGMKSQLRDTRIVEMCKAVGQSSVQTIGDLFLCVDADWFVQAVWAKVFDASDVVVVDVCNKDSIDAPIGCSENLLTEVGTAIYQNRFALCAQNRRSSQASVVRVGRCADVASASNLWHSG